MILFFEMKRTRFQRLSTQLISRHCSLTCLWFHINVYNESESHSKENSAIQDILIHQKVSNLVNSLHLTNATSLRCVNVIVWGRWRHYNVDFMINDLFGQIKLLNIMIDVSELWIHASIIIMYSSISRRNGLCFTLGESDMCGEFRKNSR